MLRLLVSLCFMSTALFVAHFMLRECGVFDRDIWRRDNPLVNPIAVTGVAEGAITLGDGRILRPAGVTRLASVDAESYDIALRAATIEGVVIIRDFGDGRAFLLVEPGFYNWCGTRNSRGLTRDRWAGSNLQAPLSEFLVMARYANPDVLQVGLTAKEKWRVEGAIELAPNENRPMPVSAGMRFRYNGYVNSLERYDEDLELMWKPPPG